MSLLGLPYKWFRWVAYSEIVTFPCALLPQKYILKMNNTFHNKLMIMLCLVNYILL